MMQLYVNNKKRIFPTDWQELMNRRKDLIYIVNLLLSKPEHTQLLTEAAMYFMKLSRLRLARIAGMFKNYPQHAHTLMLANTIFRATEPLKFLLEPFPKVEENIFFNLGKLIGSNNVLRDFTIWEFALAEQYYIEYITTRDKNSLDMFLAVWYRPKKRFNILKMFKPSDADPRVQLDDNCIESRKVYISKYSIAMKYIIFLFFHNEREKIMNRYSFIFSGKDDGNSGGGGGWLDIILSMSPLGDEEKAATTKLAVILKRLEMNHRENERIKARYNKKNIE